MLHWSLGHILRSSVVPQPRALGALHPAAAGLRLGRRHVRPELGLSHRHQRRGRHGEVVVVLLRLVRRLERCEGFLESLLSPWDRPCGEGCRIFHIKHQQLWLSPQVPT